MVRLVPPKSEPVPTTNSEPDKPTVGLLSSVTLMVMEEMPRMLKDMLLSLGLLTLVAVAKVVDQSVLVASPFLALTLK
jgi:hypothetical protein